MCQWKGKAKLPVIEEVLIIYCRYIYFLKQLEIVISKYFSLGSNFQLEKNIYINKTLLNNSF